MASLAEFLQAQQQFQNQPNALDYYKQIAEASTIPMQMRLKGLDERKTFEDYENTQRLRELFAQSQGMPGIAEVGQYSPDMAIKLQQAQLDNQVKQQQMRESQTRVGGLEDEAEIRKRKVFAEAIAPHADQYYIDVENGMDKNQALYKMRSGVGDALKNLEQQGLKPTAPFNMEALTPEAIFTATSGIYQSPYAQSRQKVAEESRMRQLPPAPTAEQAYGRGEMTPQGPVYTPPVMRQPFEVVQPEAMQDMQQAPMGAQDIDNLRMMYQQATGPQKEQLGRMLADAIKSQIPGRGEAPSGFIDPEQRQQRILAEKQAEADIGVQAEAQKTAAKERETGRAEAEDKLATIAAMPSDMEIKRLLDESIAGAPEALLKGPVATALHIDNKAQTATTVLDALHEFVKALGTKAKGDLNAQEVRSFDKAVGALGDPTLGPNARFAAYLNAKNTISRKIGIKYPDLHTKYMKGKSGKKAELVQEDDATEDEAPEAPSVKRGTKPKIGQIESGYRFKGGDPANPDNWEKQ